MPNAAYVFNCLEKDTEQTAKMFRDAEKETKKPTITRASAEMSLAHMIRQGYTREAIVHKRIAKGCQGMPRNAN